MREKKKRGQRLTHLQTRRVLAHPHPEHRPSDLDALEGDLWTRELPFALGGLVGGGGEEEQGEESEEGGRKRVGDLDGDNAAKERVREAEGQKRSAESEERRPSCEARTRTRRGGRERRRKDANSLIPALLEPELDPTLHIPLLLVPRSATLDGESLFREELLGDSDEGVAPELNLVLLVSDKRWRDHVGVAVAAEEVGVRRVGIRIVLRVK